LFSLHDSRLGYIPRPAAFKFAQLNNYWFMDPAKIAFIGDLTFNGVLCPLLPEFHQKKTSLYSARITLPGHYTFVS
jgi:hypothetical protein